MANYEDDLSDLGATPVVNHGADDLSDIGGIARHPILNKIRSMASSFMPEPQIPISMYASSGLLSNFLPGAQGKFVHDLPDIFNKSLGHETGLPEEIARGMGQYAMMPGGAPKGILGALARTGAAAGYGAAVNPLDRIQGAIQGGEMGALGEVPGLLFKGVGKVAEKINPIQYASGLKNIIRNSYQKAKEEAGNIYDKLEEKYGQNLLFKNKSGYGNDYAGYKSFNPTTAAEAYLNKSPMLKTLFERFKSNPIYENAQTLQKEIGAYTRKLAEKPSGEDINIMDALNDYRHNHLMEDMSNFLKNVDDKAHGLYEKARGITRDFLKPHEKNTNILKIAEGRKTDVSPEELHSALKSIKESKFFPENHYLRNMEQDLAKRIKTGKGLNNILSFMSGASLGEMLLPGIPGVGIGLGAGAGAYAAKALSPLAIDLVQNPEIPKLLEKFKGPYNQLRGAAIANAAHEE